MHDGIDWRSAVTSDGHCHEVSGESSSECRENDVNGDARGEAHGIHLGLNSIVVVTSRVEGLVEPVWIRSREI